MFHYKRLLSSPSPYIRYNAELIINKNKNTHLYDEMVKDDKIKSIIQELKSWPGPEISSHKIANQYFHKLVFHTDIGLDVSLLQRELLACKGGDESKLPINRDRR